MADIVASIDASMGGIPFLLRLIIWAIASAGISMALYARISPQQKLTHMKATQKETRRQLMRYDGNWDGLQALIIKDLSLALKQVGTVLLPFIISVAPMIWLMLQLAALYEGQTYSSFGPDWMRGFEFWYILVVIIASLIIKIKFKIV
jgi:hypothetical protein